MIAGVLLGLSAFAPVRPAAAWNAHGHMTVAGFAYTRLTPDVRKKVDELLRLNPNYETWVSNVPIQRRGVVAFMMGANWPDEIKQDHAHTRSGDQSSGPSATRNIGYTDDLVHGYWHYIDVPFSPDGTPLGSVAAPNVETQIAAFRAALASSSTSDDVKSYDLVWLLHLVGDVHQPLHAVSRFDREERRGDRGGSGVRICEPTCGTSLHYFWDDALGMGTDPQAAIDEASRLPTPDRGLAGIADEAKWVEESFQLAKTAVYIDPVGIGPGPFTVDGKYKEHARAIAVNQVALAGARLANLLNDALKTVAVGSHTGVEPSSGQGVGAATERMVMFNERTGKYHDPACDSVRRCTHCVSVPLSEAVRRGGRACKVCRGGRN
ncbi:MAG TPA: S1/P1 nuclease [Polyangia bacterium]|nr:S1/P1 nuclease [Polyangia bacterium]